MNDVISMARPPATQRKKFHHIGVNTKQHRPEVEEPNRLQDLRLTGTLNAAELPIVQS